MNEVTGVRRAIGGLERGQSRLAMLALVVMMMTTVAEVVLRYGFGRPIHGAYDMVEVCLPIFVFNGMATVFYNRQNIVIDVVDHVAGPRVAAVLARVGEALTVLVLGVVAVAMVAPALQAYDYGDRKLELGLPVAVVWAFALFGIVGALVCAIGAILRRPPAAPDRHP